MGPYVFLDPALVPGQAEELQQGRGVRLAGVGRQSPQLVGPEVGDDGDIERGIQASGPRAASARARTAFRLESDTAM